MARSKRIKETAAGVAYYHVISRTNNKVFLFDSATTKDALVDALKRSAAFSGVEIEAYAVMSNHIHAVVKVARPGCAALSMGPVPNAAASSAGPVPNAFCWSYDRSLSEGCENSALACENAGFAASPMGSVPKAWWMRRVVQIGAGKVFGSATFVMRKASGLGHLFSVKHVVARAVGEIGFATHGWKLAKTDEARRTVA